MRKSNGCHHPNEDLLSENNKHTNHDEFSREFELFDVSDLIILPTQAIGYLSLRYDTNDTSNLQENTQDPLPPLLEELGEKYYSITWLSQSSIWCTKMVYIKPFISKVFYKISIDLKDNQRKDLWNFLWMWPENLLMTNVCYNFLQRYWV